MFHFSNCTFRSLSKKNIYKAVHTSLCLLKVSLPKKNNIYPYSKNYEFHTLLKSPHVFKKSREQIKIQKWTSILNTTWGHTKIDHISHIEKHLEEGLWTSSFLVACDKKKLVKDKKIKYKISPSILLSNLRLSHLQGCRARHTLRQIFFF